ncbi:hypothetical protein [Puniceibacterium sediminis]|uniref:Conserved repeat domain-containing protein n=1 Tax=Puniceibacterium sediminis TaxID=1608407 RepID=A0A238XLS5_9RHOB|nr:hypothetical protein [Puniceibacterium sediminis]SNR59541.1 conserved repeat domain-containing protein [Puniceibacterium sediminis]
MRSFLRTAGLCAATLIQTVVLMLALLPQTSMADPAPGGTLIRNIAQATYFNNALGIMETVVSNPVEAQVFSVPNVEVTGYSDLLLSRGAMAQYYFEVRNNGNVPIGALLTMQNGMTGGQLVADLNGNGRVDDHERAFDLSAPVPLLMGESVQTIYEFRVPHTVTPGETLDSTLVVTALVDGGANRRLRLGGEAQGVTRIVSGALEIEKYQSVRETDTASEIDYTLHVRNNSELAVAGYSAIDGEPLRIDGAVSTGVLVRDMIPLNTVFRGISNAGGMVALFHRSGDPKHDYLTQQPRQAEEVDAIGFFLEGEYAVGLSTDPSFSVGVPKVLGDVDILNTAVVYLDGEERSAALTSNTTVFTRNNAGSGVLRFENPETGDGQAFGAPGRDTRLRLNSGACNLTTGVDTTTVTLRSLSSGDVETVTATESASNSGVFLTTVVPLARMDNAVSGDQVMATTDGDTLIATAQCGGAMLEDTLLINPGNFLFNSVTNAPVDGVNIALVNATSGTEMARAVTDPRGFFAFGDVPAGSYRYEVVNAPDWEFPSVRMDFPGFGRLMARAGYGAAFDHAGGMVYVSDIPVDPHYGAPLSLQKTTDRETVGNGEFVIYTLEFANNMNQALIGAEILDRPSRGVTLVPGSVVLDGEPLADPVDAQGGDMLFDLGMLAPLSDHELTYVMHFTAAAREGRNENTAVLSGRQAGTGTPRQSNVARAMVRLDNSGGVFAREGTVIGSVFMDCDANGIRGDISEPGIPGVRIVTQEGLSVVTDIDGKYSLYGLRPVTHAFLVQNETLPAGTEVTVTRTNDLKRGGSRLIPLRKGEMRAEHFAVAECTAEALAEVAKRRAHFDENQQANSLTAADLPIEGQRAPVRSSRGDQGIATTTQLTPGMLIDEQVAGEDVAAKAQALARRQSLDAMIKTLDSKPGFVDLEDGQTVVRSTQNIRVKGKADLTLALMLNGRELGSDRVGERTNWEKNNVQALEYIAVKLGAGKNTLSLVGKDGFGIERVRKEITLIAPGKPARFEIILPETASASPVSVVPVVVRVLDARGLPVPASSTVTLHARSALWDVTDIRPGTPGVQAYLDNGEATFGLIPPQVAGPDRITVTGNFGSAEATITFTPDLDERILIGVIEGAVALGKNNGALLDKDRFSSFEDTATGVRGEVYLKGAIRGDALLTLRYSSDRDTEDRLFRDIRGDEYYPVYGDNSERGQDAQSSGNLFVKVEKGRSYILYGDIAIEPEASAFKLDGLRRVATGAKAHWENDKVSVTVFGARTAQEQMVQEIRGRGISGPYDLDLGGYVQGSERVEILVRDEQGGDILTSTPMRRGTDYILDFFRDTITFDTPIRQFDPDGNPVSIRVTYEVEAEGAETYWLYGGEANYAVGERTTIGARVVHADAPIGNPARERLQSGYIRREDKVGGIWEAELARSEDSRGEVDGAARLSYELQTESQWLSFEAIHTGENFLARGGLARPGTTQVRLSYGYEIDRKSDIALGAEMVRDRINDTDRLTVEALYSRRISKQLRGDIGFEYRQDRRQNVTDAETSLTLGAHWTPLNRPDTVIEAELHQPLSGREAPTELTLGLYREPKQGWRVYNEVEVHFADDVVMSRATLGFTFELNEWLSGRTELTRGAGEIDTTLHQGLNAHFKLNETTTLDLGIEHSRMMDANEAELTSVAVGMKWGSGDGDWVGDADFDTTFENSGNTYYASLGLAGKVTPDLTVLGRTRVAVDQRNGNDHRRMRTRAGVAYRPLSDPRLEVLAWYEHRLEEKHNRTESHLWSVDASYEVDADLRLNGKYAGQHQKIDVSGGTSASATTQLVQAGLSYEFGENRFQIGANVAQLWDDAGNTSSGLGAEFGFVPTKGTLLAIGYNKADGRLAGQSALYQEGFYFRFNLLIDNSLWDQLDGFLGN